MFSKRLSSFFIAGWIFFSWSLLWQNPLIPCMLKEARADQQTDIAPVAESHAASVSTFTQRSGGGTAALYDADGLTFSRTRTGGFTDSFLDNNQHSHEWQAILPFNKEGIWLF